MGDVVNLNRYRKQRERLDAKREARENRIRHGRTAADKERERVAAERRERDLAGKQRDDPDSDTPEVG